MSKRRLHLLHGFMGSMKPFGSGGDNTSPGDPKVSSWITKTCMNENLHLNMLTSRLSLYINS